MRRSGGVRNQSGDVRNRIRDGPRRAGSNRSDSRWDDGTASEAGSGLLDQAHGVHVSAKVVLGVEGFAAGLADVLLLVPHDRGHDASEGKACPNGRVSATSLLGSSARRPTMLVTRRTGTRRVGPAFGDKPSHPRRVEGNIKECLEIANDCLAMLYALPDDRRQLCSACAVADRRYRQARTEIPGCSGCRRSRATGNDTARRRLGIRHERERPDDDRR